MSNLRPIDNYYLQHPEPTKSCLQCLRVQILKMNANVTEAWKYGMPFFCYNGKMMCYLWVHKKYKLPYIGFVKGKLIDDPDLLIEKRAMMKILLINPNEDLLMDKTNNILNQMLNLYK